LVYFRNRIKTALIIRTIKQINISGKLNVCQSFWFFYLLLFSVERRKGAEERGGGKGRRKAAVGRGGGKGWRG